MLAAVMTRARSFIRPPQFWQSSTSILKLLINSSCQGRYPERWGGRLGLLGASRAVIARVVSADEAHEATTTKTTTPSRRSADFRLIVQAFWEHTARRSRPCPQCMRDHRRHNACRPC